MAGVRQVLGTGATAGSSTVAIAKTHRRGVIDKAIIPPIIEAVWNRSAEDVERHARANSSAIDDTSTGLAALHYAAQDNACLLGQILLDHGGCVDVRNCFGETPLHDAALNGALDFCNLLVERGATLDV